MPHTSDPGLEGTELQLAWNSILRLTVSEDAIQASDGEKQSLVQDNFKFNELQQWPVWQDIASGTIEAL